MVVWLVLVCFVYIDLSHEMSELMYQIVVDEDYFEMCFVWDTRAY